MAETKLIIPRPPAWETNDLVCKGSMCAVTPRWSHVDVRGTKDAETTSGYLHGGGRTHFSCQSSWAITFLSFVHVFIDFLKEIKSYFFFFEPGPLMSFVLKGLYNKKKKNVMISSCRLCFWGLHILCVDPQFKTGPEGSS